MAKFCRKWLNVDNESDAVRPKANRMCEIEWIMDQQNIVHFDRKHTDSMEYLPLWAMEAQTMAY